MPEITTTIGANLPRQIHIRRGRFACLNGREAGRTWLLDRDLVRIGAQPDNDIALSDPTVSRHHAEVLRTREGVVLRDAGSTNGTFVGSVRVREVYLTPETRFRVGHTELVFAPVDEVIEVIPSNENRFENMVGASMTMRELFGVLERVAPTELTVLITGETGTGKELVSRALHNRSRRSKGPFIVFDSGAATESLIESELFGHERGAFTGAIASRPGVFELAEGGTVFMDEIGELPLDLQPKFLRVLEQREVRRVGSNRVRNVDVRIVAATNRNLREEVEAGRFREDLYYRLAVVEIELPPLRDRMQDLPLLVDHMLRQIQHNRTVNGVSPDVIKLFNAYHWPGNVRELCNVIERAIPFSTGPLITMESLPDSLRASSRPSSPIRVETDTPVPGSDPLQRAGQPLETERVSDLPYKDAKDQLIEAFERQYLIDLIERHDGNVSRAARAAGMDRKSVTRLLKKHGITR